MADILIYLVIFIVFLVLCNFLYKYNLSLVGVAAKMGQQPQDNRQMADLAKILGITYQDLSANTANIYNTGYRLAGTYKDIPIEIIMAGSTSKVEVKPFQQWSYSIQKTITLTVKNPQNKSFVIRPKSKQLVSEKTGDQQFDEKLALRGDKVIPSSLIQYIGSLGWLNLELKGNKLLFNDTYFEDQTTFQRAKAVHPIWGISAKQPTMDVQRIKYFIDKLVDLAKRSGLS